jgi:hypothetical protein
MKPILLLLAASAFALNGCASRRPSPAPEQAVIEHGCYNPVPDFERLVAERASREQVESRFGSEAERVTDETALRKVARSKLTPENLAVFRRYRAATISFMECDNQVVALFDDTGRIVAFQAM